jgi:hypothetical protein
VYTGDGPTRGHDHVRKSRHQRHHCPPEDHGGSRIDKLPDDGDALQPGSDGAVRVDEAVAFTMSMLRSRTTVRMACTSGQKLAANRTCVKDASSRGNSGAAASRTTSPSGAQAPRCALGRAHRAGGWSFHARHHTQRRRQAEDLVGAAQQDG